MPVYLKVVMHEWKNESRDIRELYVARELGYRIIVIATTKELHRVTKTNKDGLEIIQIPTRRFGVKRFTRILSKIEAVRLFIQEIKKTSPHIISGHNFDGWLIGYLACGKSGIYIYDSHEFELEQTNSKNILEYHIVKMLEHFIVRHSAINMMVSDSISCAVQKIHGITKKPLVIRNIPEKSTNFLVNREICRQEFIRHLAIDDTGIILMYHGSFAKNRGIEQAIKAVTRLKNVGLVLLGYALDQQYEQSLIRSIELSGCADRIYIKHAVPFSQLYENIAACDLEIVLIQNTCTSFYYCLPNKLFESIQAETPIIGSDFPEIENIVEKYGVGITIKPDDVDELVKSIQAIWGNKNQYKHIKENLKYAKQELCWEKEKVKLLNAIKNIDNL